MVLEFSRAKLNKALLEVDLAQRGQEVDQDFVQIIDDWFNDLKEEESKDTVAAALKDHRLTARVVLRRDEIKQNLALLKPSTQCRRGS